jgi:arylsulfatase A-like enzyme
MDRRKFIRTAGAAAGASLIGQKMLADVLPFGSSSQDKRPNILLIMTDQQSADAMSFWLGKKYINTPVMDEVASKGVVFTNAYSPNPLCVPCRTSIFTGLYPHQTGVQTNADKNKSLSGKITHMGTIFKEAGYDTGYIGKWHMAFPAKEKATHGFDFMRSIKDIGIDNEVPGGAEEFLNIKRDKPFLLVTSFVNPHNICEWARGDILPDADIGTPPPVDQCPPLVENTSPMENEPEIIPQLKKSYQNSKLFPVGNFDENKWREYRWAYYRMIEKVDALIGKVIQSLRNSGQYENTVIVFTSDHGDMQGAHGWNQKTVLFEESTRVPLIISEPNRNKQVAVVSLVNTGIDILPTLCDYAGIKLPQNYPGISLKDDEINKREYIVVENKMIQGEPIEGQKPEPSGRMIRSKKYKYCAYDIGKRNESLVDIGNDPGEMKNVAGQKEYKKILDQHRQCLLEWCKKYDDSFSDMVSSLNN